MAQVKEESSFLAPEELLYARGRMVTQMPVIIADTILEGVNIGCYYTFMFGQPEKHVVADQKEKFDLGLNKEVAKWLKVAEDSKRLLGDIE